MKLIEKIKLIRSFPSSLDLKYELFFTTSILVLGLGLGFISKMLDSNLTLGDIFTGFGPWIFIATLIATYSRYPISAMINTMIFFLGMLLTYYAYSYFRILPTVLHDNLAHHDFYFYTNCCFYCLVFKSKRINWRDLLSTSNYYVIYTWVFVFQLL